LNLSQAKSILIIAFLGLNIFLGYHLWLEPQTTVVGPTQQEELERLEKELAEANVQLKVSLPRQVQRSSFLTVKPAEFEKIAERILSAEEELSVQREEDRNIYITEKGRLSVHRSGLITYERCSGEILDDGATTMEKDDALELIEGFIERYELNPGSAALDYLLQTPETGLWQARYTQSYQGLPLFTGYLEVVAGREGVREFALYWLEPLEFQEGNEMEVISITVALRRLLEELETYSNEETAVTNISFGFYSKEYDAQKWEMPPVWRFRVNDTQTYYINAFTGNLEENVQHIP
jgi:regulatory protein YycI of two-component signal transduction system YycFG